METIPATVGILTFNSAKGLPRALESVRAFDDMVICDGGSTDGTQDIARSFGCRVIEQDTEFKNPDGSLRNYAGARNQCLDAARYDWFFYIDSDEIAEEALVREVAGIVAQESPTALVYNISPRIVLDGTLIEHSSNYPGWQKRFFSRASGARFRKEVHERIAFDEERYPAGYLAGHWRYFISSDQDPAKNRRYALMDARAQATRSIPRLLYLTARKCATALKVFLIAVYNRLRYGARALPVRLEFTRVRYHLYIAGFLWAAYFSSGEQPHL